VSFLLLPPSGQTIDHVKFPEPAARLELVSLPLVPAPLETRQTSMVSCQCHVDLGLSDRSGICGLSGAAVSQPLGRRGAEKYQTRLLSPSDYPYILAKK